MHSSSSTMKFTAPSQQTVGMERANPVCHPIAELGYLPLLRDLLAGLQSADLHAPTALRCKQVLALTNESRSQHYNRGNSKSAAYDPAYPHGFYLGGSTSRRWWQHEVVAWLQARAAAVPKV
jgi:predicted DNA-binding transcriptional regulator AlpA